MGGAGFPASPFHHLSLILIFGATGTSYMSEQKSARGFHLGNGLAVLRKDPHAMEDPHSLYGTPGSTDTQKYCPVPCLMKGRMG